MAFYRLINRPTVGGVNVIADLSSFSIGRQKIKLELSEDLTIAPL